MTHLRAKKNHAATKTLWFVAFLTFAFFTCQFQFGSKNPVTGRKEIAFISEEEEIEIGEELFPKLILESGGRYTDDPELSQYVRDVGLKLAKLSDRPNLPYEFVIVNDDSFNAWALPGGKIAINKGLLLLLENEAELAAILGHEITHAAARHTAERWERYTIRPCTDALFAIFNPVQAAFLAANLPDEMVESKYSRDAEYEADQYGLEYMARAGYDLEAAKTVHEKLKHSSDAEDFTESPIETLLNSHPDDEQRIQNIDNLTRFYPGDGKLETAIYQQKTAILKNKDCNA